MAESTASQPVQHPRHRKKTFRVNVRLFAWVAESAGKREVTIELTEGAHAARAIAKTLEAAGIGEAYGPSDSVRLAVNREYVGNGHEIRAGDELALIPPVSGGAPAHVRITAEPLDMQAMSDLVVTDGAGAVVVFTGITREVQLLSYEAYEEMAEACIAQIVVDLFERYKLEGVAIEHRVGDVPTSEPSVIVAVSSRHRPAAFTAAHEAIDRIKSEAPIWKLEVEAGYRSWVRGVQPSTNRR